jgi:pyrroline-5-carboxylate reductase
MPISFVGGGKMGEAIVSGILEAGVAAGRDVRIAEPVEARRDYLSKKLGVEVRPAAADVLDGADLVVLAVQPKDLAAVMRDVGPGLTDGQVVVSIVAGAVMNTLLDGLGHDAVIRVMPNTPAQIGAGMTVWTASSAVPEAQIEATRRILQTLGEELYVADERLVDMATALSASGPAYVFLFIEALIDAGVYLGMPRDMARKLTLQTVAGSTRLVDETGLHPAQLKDMVTSPGGTTIEALRTFERGRFRATVIDAVKAAYEKSQALGTTR